MSETRIAARCEFYKERIGKLETILRKKAAMPVAMRDSVYLHFLCEEVALYRYCLQEMSALRDNAEDQQVIEKFSGFARTRDMIPSLGPLGKKEMVNIHFVGGLGDMLCSTPALKKIRHEYPSLKIILTLDTQKKAELFANNSDFDILQLVNSEQHQNSPPDITISVGYQGTDVYYREPSSIIIGKALGVVVEDIKPVYQVSEEERKQAADTVAEVGAEKLVLLGAVSRIPVNQNWPIERWQAIVDTFPEVTFAQIGLPDEPVIKGTIDWRLEGKLRDTFALMEQADCYLGMDTLWGHAAAAVNTRAVTLFGGTHPSVFTYPNHIAIYKNLRCSPCHARLQKRPCPYDTECINGIEIEEVADALRSVIF